MLVCERWTLTQSSGWAAGLALALLLGLAAMTASREAETVAVAEFCDDVEAEPVADGELVADVDADDGAPEPGLGVGVTLVGGGDAGVLLDVPPDAGAVGEGEADVAEPEGEGVGVGVGLEVDGCGVGVLAGGSTWHLVSVFALAVVLALADVLVLAFTVPARAAPGQPASTPRVRNPPASWLSTAARTCARRMNIALSTLLIEVTVCSLWDSEATG